MKKSKTRCPAGAGGLGGNSPQVVLFLFLGYRITTITFLFKNLADAKFLWFIFCIKQKINHSFLSKKRKEYPKKYRMK